MRAIHRKLRRDLWEIRGPAAAIAAVMAVGIAMFITYFTTFDSLRRTQRTYYDRLRMADVFASLKRAPRSLEPRLAAIPGVASLEARVVADVTLDIAGLSEPAIGRLVSIPERRRAMLNDLTLLRGRYIEAERPDEVLVSEGFAEAHGLGPGDSVAAIINGRRRALEVVGIALSPEFVYTLRPGELIPDDSRFGVFWIGREAIANAFDMEGGFNDLLVRLMPGASADEVIARIDDLVATYGGLGAIPRSLQTSAWYLDNELRQLQGFGAVMPMVFLAVAAFLLHVVLQRTVAVQREQIAALKALGYSNLEVGGHYALWAVSIAILGALAGIVAGKLMAGGMLGMYNDYFRFPFLEHRTAPQVVAAAVAASVAASLAGAAAAVRRAVALPPAEAMRPEPPARYRATLVERLGLGRWVAPAGLIVLRNLERRPLRAAASVAGIAASGALLIAGLFFLDSIEVLLDMQFNLAQRQDVTVSMVEPVSRAAFHELGRLPGVLEVEVSRSVPVRLRAGHRSRQTAITALPAEARLRRIVDGESRVATLPPEGVVLTTALAEILDLTAGDQVRLEVLEGARPVRHAVVSGLVDEPMGTAVYMDLDAVHRLLREGQNLSQAYLRVDPLAADELYGRLKQLPSVAGVAVKKATLAVFDRQMDQTMGIIVFFNVLFASVIAVGVVYNSARITLSERSRELASLRVMGFTRGEISSILLGELATLTAVAVPVGLALGYALAAFIVRAFETELYRFPLAVSLRTYSASALVVLTAATVSGLLVRRKLDRLDLIEVLKSRE